MIRIAVLAVVLALPVLVRAQCPSGSCGQAQVQVTVRTMPASPSVQFVPVPVASAPSPVFVQRVPVFVAQSPAPVFLAAPTPTRTEVRIGPFGRVRRVTTSGGW